MVWFILKKGKTRTFLLLAKVQGETHLLTADAEGLSNDLDEAAVAQTQFSSFQVNVHFSSEILSHQLCKERNKKPKKLPSSQL